MDYSRIALLSSIAFAIIILFYPLSVGSFFHPDVYRFEDRTTYHQYFEERYIFSQIIDNLIVCLGFLGWSFTSLSDSRVKALFMIIFGSLLIVGLSFPTSIVMPLLSLASLPLIFSIHLINKRTNNRLLHRDSSLLTVNYFMIGFLILVTLSIFISVSASDINNPFIDIMTLVSRFAPVLMLLVIFSFFIRISLKRIVSIIPKLKSGSAVLRTFGIPEYEGITRFKKTVLLSAFMGLSILIVLMPHSSGELNPVGEDTTIYFNWAQDLRASEDVEHFAELIFSGIQAGDRPLSLLILYIILDIFDNDKVTAFEIFLPAILAPLLVLSIYFLTREISKSALVSLAASLVTALSFQIMIGVYAGLFANWIALVLGYISLWLAVRFLNTESRKYMIYFSISMTALLFSHSYTWTIITTFLIIFLIVLRWKKIYRSKSIRTLFIIVICVVGIDLAKSILIESSSAIQRNVTIAESTEVGLSEFSERWTVLVRTVNVFLGGIFGNVIILSLVLYCSMMFKFKNLVGYFFMVFISLGILPFFYGDKILQSRVLYDIPFQIPAGLALASVFVSRNGKLISIVIGASLLAIALYTMTNLGVAPR